MITGDKIMINPKFKTPIEIQNYSRVVIITNNDHAAQIKAGDRRYSVFETVSAWQNTTKHSQLVDQLANGGAAKFLHDALNAQFRRIENTSTLVIQRPLHTPAKIEQIALSRSPLEKFLVHSLITGSFTDQSQWLPSTGLPTAWKATETLEVESQAMFGYARKYIEENSGPNQKLGSLQSLCSHAEKYWGSFNKTRAKLPASVHGRRMQGPTTWIIPSRSDAIQHAFNNGLITKEELYSSGAIDEPSKLRLIA